MGLPLDWHPATVSIIIVH